MANDNDGSGSKIFQNRNRVSFDQYSFESFHFLEQEIPPKLLSLLDCMPENYTLVDLGCGDGALLYTLSTSGYLERAYQVIGIDSSAIRIERLKKTCPSINAVHGDISALPYIEENSVDLVISTQVIEHLPDDLQFLMEVHRILSSRGTFYLTTVLKKWYGIYFYRNNRGDFVLDRTHIREYKNLTELTSLYNQAYLKIQTINQYQFAPPLYEFIVRVIVKCRLLNPTIAGQLHLRSPFLNAVRKNIRFPVLGYKTIEVIATR